MLGPTNASGEYTLSHDFAAFDKHIPLAYHQTAAFRTFKSRSSLGSNSSPNSSKFPALLQTEIPIAAVLILSPRAERVSPNVKSAYPASPRRRRRRRTPAAHPYVLSSRMLSPVFYIIPRRSSARTHRRCHRP